MEVSNSQPAALDYDIEEMENTEYLEEESDEYDQLFFNEANCDAETLVSEDAATLKTGFGSNSEAWLLRGIVRSPTTI